MYSYKLFVLLVLVVLLQEGVAKHKKKHVKRSLSKRSTTSEPLRGVYVCKSIKACSTDKSCPNDYKYLPANQVCDGVGQCPCDDDEEMCGRCLSPECPGMFQCKNSTCIEKNKVCDTKMDCGENEDEHNCTPPLLIRPRQCFYIGRVCYSQFDVPEESKIEIFIDEYPVSFFSLCQSACNAYEDCQQAIVKREYTGAVVTGRTCVVSRLTVAQIQAIEGTTITILDDCLNEPTDGIRYFVYSPMCQQ